ncbi:ATP-binding protein [Shewanella pneumatophori]|uniref:ATP-binding protein n=1 Tax=Shewanella pneumatophori TaxID=314092 RepID=A0A9X1ZIR5_9GAMM|nr:ATP-binding protein [Shewanella pneumatophori]
MNTRTFHKQYISSLEASRLVADDIVPFWQQLNIDLSIIGQMELCLVEIVNNVFEHAYGNTEGPLFDISSHLNDKQQLTIEISDYGNAMPKHILEDLPTADFVEPVADDPTTWLQSSRGLKIVQELTDTIEYTSTDKRNTFKLLKEAG